RVPVGQGSRRLRRLTCRRNKASPHVSCYPREPTVGRRDRPRIGAVCPLVRLVSGVGDHIIGDRPRPDPVWETAGFSVTPAPTALLHLLPVTGGCHDPPQSFLPCPWPPGPYADVPAVTRALRRPPDLPPPCRWHRHRRSRALGRRAPGVRPPTRAPFRYVHRRPRRSGRLAH